MSLTTASLLTIIAATAGIVAAMVAPLYILLLRQQGKQSGTDAAVKYLDDDQDSLEERLNSIDAQLSKVATDVELNGQQITVNQQHIHELLVGRINAEDVEIGNPHYKAEYCPLSGHCPFCDHGGE